MKTNSIKIMVQVIYNTMLNNVYNLYERKGFWATTWMYLVKPSLPILFMVPCLIGVGYICDKMDKITKELSYIEMLLENLDYCN